MGLTQVSVSRVTQEQGLKSTQERWEHLNAGKYWQEGYGGETWEPLWDPCVKEPELADR